MRNLRNPDPKTRLSAVKLLREAKYPEAIAPMAPLVNDPIDDIQLEAIARRAVVLHRQDVKARRMIGFVVERRNPRWPPRRSTSVRSPSGRDPVPPELVSALLQAIDDDNAARTARSDVRDRRDREAAAGAAIRPRGSIKALDHYDPAVRTAAARVIAPAAA